MSSSSQPFLATEPEGPMSLPSQAPTHMSTTPPDIYIYTNFVKIHRYNRKWKQNSVHTCLFPFIIFCISFSVPIKLDMKPIISVLMKSSKNWRCGFKKITFACISIRARYLLKWPVCWGWSESEEAGLADRCPLIYIHHQLALTWVTLWP